MAEPIESTISKYIDHDISLEAAHQSIVDWTISHRGDDKFIQYGIDLVTELHSNQKLDDQSKETFLAAIKSPEAKAAIQSADEDGGDIEKTVLLGGQQSDEEAEEKTVLLGGQGSEDDIEEKTVLLSGQDVTVEDEPEEKTILLNQNKPEAEKTKILSDENDEATVVLGRQQEDDDKTTLLVEEDDDDATVVSGAPVNREDEADATIVASFDDEDDATVVAGSDRDDEDEDATVVAGASPSIPAEEEDDDATIVADARPRTPDEDDDATVVASTRPVSTEDDDEDATVVAGATQTTSSTTSIDEDATQIADSEGGEKTQIVSPADVTSKTTKKRGDRTDMTGRQEDFGILYSGDDEEGEELVVGSILKERFNLVSVLGEGGMGMVFKAVDMLKVEAKDQNPYVAIKVLTGDFKEHPDAFISLQRETSKAQKLAHPNISTVYDFDRHKGTVYMTMELLNGEPLDEFIKDKMPAEGLSQPLALSIVKGLGEGLAYAHDQGLVHSDFKPGNAFILDVEDIDHADHIESGGVKVIDFGIARAASTTSGEKSLHEDEVFDAGSLGALTPAYATVEMFNGEDPHPSDDIYALACVACQLLTGQHPFKKKPAPKAKDLRLKPPLIPGFTKRQQRALEKGLAFERQNRTQTMEEFLDGIRRRKDYTVQIILGLLVSFALIGGLGYKPVTNYYEQKEIQELIVATNDGPDVGVKQTLEAIQTKSTEYQTAVKTGIRERALEVYVKDIRSLVNPDKKLYEYVKAEETIKKILSYYPDSSVIAEISNEVEESKQVLLGQLHEQYIEQLLKERFLPEDGKDDIVDVLALLKSVEAQDPLFGDPRLQTAYHKATSKAIDRKDFDLAKQYLKIANTYVANHTIFFDLSDEIKIAEFDEQLALEQKKTEDSFAGKTLTINDYRNYVDDLVVLSLNSSYESRQYKRFKTLFDAEFEKQLDRSATSAKDLYTVFAKALKADEIISYLERTGLAPKLTATVSASNYPRIHFVNNRTNTVALINHMSSLRNSIVRFRNNVLSYYNANFESTMDPLATQLRPTLISYYKDLYSSLLIDETNTSITRQTIETKNNLTANVKNIYARAVVENDKRIFRNFANDNRLKESVDKYNIISAASNESDNEFLDFARKEIARMYSTLAESNATEFKFTNAYDYILKAKEYFIDEDIEKQERNYKKEVMTEEIAALILTRDEDDKIKALDSLEFLKNEYEDEFRYIKQNISSLINKQIVELANTELIDAHRLKKYALSIIDTRELRNVPIKSLPPPSLLAAQGKIEVSQFNLTAAKSTLAEARTQTPNHYQVDELEEALNERIKIAQDLYRQHEKLYTEEKYQLANDALRETIENWKDNPEYLARRDYYDRVMVQVNAGSKLCRTDLQGIGKRNRGACNDIVKSTKEPAPTMVVIPAMSKDSEPYAISKYEISIKNINDFCAQSDLCTPASGDLEAFPATKVPTQIIKEYAEWLSNETGFKYDIASYDQWFNATSAAGREGNSDYNCRLRLGTKLIKGQNIVPVESGAQNNWGLINYVGNVDEIVKKDQGFVLVGGNFSDSISDCKITLTKPLEISGTSGFRLVRSLN